MPDCTLVFDLDVGTALTRARCRASTTVLNRRFEDEPLTFHAAVAATYRDLARREPGRVVLVNARGTADEVHVRVLAFGGAPPMSTSQLPWPASRLFPVEWLGVQRLLAKCLVLHASGALPGTLMVVGAPRPRP